MLNNNLLGKSGFSGLAPVDHIYGNHTERTPGYGMGHYFFAQEKP